MPLTSDDIADLYYEHSTALLRFLMRRTFDAQVAIDLLAETYAVAFEKRASVRELEGARAWLFTVANNLLAEFYRDGQIERRGVRRLGIDVPLIDDADIQRIEDLAETAELRATVATGLGELSDEHRTALELRVVQERSYQEVAMRMGVSEEVARARVSRALKKLKGIVERVSSEERKEVVEHA